MAVYLNVDQACLFLHVKKSYLYKLVHERKIPSYSFNSGRLLFSEEELEALVKSSRRSTHDELCSKADALLNSRGR